MAASGAEASRGLGNQKPFSSPPGPSRKLESNSIMSTSTGPADNTNPDMKDNTRSNSNSSELNHSSTTPTRTDSMSDDTGFPLDTADEKDEVSSTVSNLSDLTGISILSDDEDGGLEWKNASSWVQKQIVMGTDPRDVLKLLFSDPTQVPVEVDDYTLWRIVLNMMSEPPKRQKLSHINTLTEVVELIKKSQNIIVLTGAGVSVSCGIPDFRSRDGIYSRLAQDFPDLPDPQAMFDINYFSQDPRPFYKFAREIYPGQFKPSPCHEFIKILEKQKKLLRNYSQNIDTLERVAGIKNLIECHGSFATASCTKCKYRVRSNDIKDDIFAQKIPMCPKCRERSLPPIAESDSNENYRDLVAQGVMKPDIVFFGEGLPDAFHEAMATDKDVCDLLIVMGSSLKVRPVALIPSSIPPNVPQILINRESLSHLEFDVELLGDGDVVIDQLCHMLDGSFKNICWRDIALKEASSLLPPKFPTNDSWESIDTMKSKDSSDDDQIQKLHSAGGSSSKRELEDHDQRKSNSSTNDRPWKKLKNEDSRENVPEGSANISSPSRSFMGIENCYKKDENCCGDVISRTACFDSDSDSVTPSDDASQHREAIEHQGNTENIDRKIEFGERDLWNEEDRKKFESSRLRDTLQDVDRAGVKNLSFKSEFTEHVVKNFTFIDDGHERHLLFDSSSRRRDIESSPSSIGSPKKSMTLSSGESPTTSYESSRAAEEIFIPEDCHVVPRIDCLRDDSILESSLGPSEASSKSDLKPRHASIDSVMDSALGDSCSSSDCQKRKSDSDNTEDIEESHKLDSWKLPTKDSLALRLPDNSYYQLKPGKYIFPGAEVYTSCSWNEGGLEMNGVRLTTTNQLSEN
ncbi:hypothetical protein QAD02_001027 [Eretmocerus hayati]|uniref:Uncharacterized protein n=1 Tax=Eretmocerus hayati TaxID=131215 RepID=A0ACC2NG49_9HYME|nr:hypothetical protein QAD02_001027 [Eretmocerus hayati]